MNSKFLIWLGLLIGSTVGSFIPLLWGGNTFSFLGVILSAVGGGLGIWAGYKLSQGI
ncbi:hypothetical protein IPN41_01855 [Candidatus Falkowbacteria bacterium]|nr:MAG: hypothetical protein IPN41_01855 [Candidatus Falkowbacteria bacterium]